MAIDSVKFRWVDKEKKMYINHVENLQPDICTDYRDSDCVTPIGIL
jgi:hypothetical protein